VEKRSAAAPEMTVADVLWVLTVMDEAGLEVWLDGGWAVDACLGAQRRRHRDLDLAIEARHVPAAIDALKRRGFAVLPAEWNFMLGDRTGRLIDFHVVVLDDAGRGVFGPPRNAEWGAADALSGEGTVGGRSVRCLTPHALVAFHAGYELDADDWADVRALCERFDIPIPGDPQRFR
jgi:lincosamide nucleotidyltransferase A/C/D/E